MSLTGQRSSGGQVSLSDLCKQKVRVKSRNTTQNLWKTCLSYFEENTLLTKSRSSHFEVHCVFAVSICTRWRCRAVHLHQFCMQNPTSHSCSESWVLSHLLVSQIAIWCILGLVLKQTLGIFIRPASLHSFVLELAIGYYAKHITEDRRRCRNTFGDGEMIVWNKKPGYIYF